MGFYLVEKEKKKKTVIILLVIKIIFSNEQQKIINSNLKNNIFINAGAGTGKTTTIIGIVNKLINEMKVPEEKILIITFTNKACENLINRIKNQNIKINTFHKLIYDTLKNNNLSQKLISDEDIIYSDELLNLFSKYKNKLLFFKPYLFNEYQKYLHNNNLIDFDDLFLIFIRKNIKLNYNYIFIDEFQDTNNLQYQIIKILVKKIKQ